MSSRFIGLSLFCLVFTAVLTAGAAEVDNGATAQIQCTFLPLDLCGWENEVNDEEVTTTFSRFTPQMSGLFGFGPENDHTGDDFYATTRGLGGKLARLYTPMVQGSMDFPATGFTFWYHVGSTLANLTVYLVHEDRSKPMEILWTIPSDGVALSKTDPWLSARMTVYYPAKFQVAFEANMNGTGTGVYVALDDVFLQIEKSLPTCDFEDSFYGNFCIFDQVNNGSSDDFDWTRQTGETPSLDTGPLFDHTVGDGQSGHYLFIEATRPEEEKKAIIRSIELYKTQGGPCMLKFYYHAFGIHLGELNVFIAEQVYPITLISADEWKKQEIDLKDVSGKYQIAFEGIRGDGNLGDVAIDDISFVGNNCIGVDACSSYPCLNGGTCTPVNKGFKCDCSSGYLQPQCEGEPVKKPLSQTVIVVISVGAACSGIFILVIIYLLCCSCRSKNNQSNVNEDDKHATQLAMTNNGYDSDGHDDQNRSV